MPKQKSKILNGKTLADEILHDIRQEIVEKKITPCLAAVLVGDDKPSKIYVKLKQKACIKCGIGFFLYHLPKKTAEEQVIECIEFLNHDKKINGIIVQLPLPKHLNENKIIAAINPQKDADGFHPKNLDLLLKNKPCIAPGLCEGIIKLLKETKKDLAHKKILIISNSKIFSRPLGHLLSQELCKSEKKCSWVWTSPKDKNLKNKTAQTDAIIIAAGKPKFLKPEMIKKDCLIIDVGYNRIKDKITGDVDSSCSSKAGWLSPVPGGVGPMTVAMLLANTLKLHKLQSERRRG